MTINVAPTASGHVRNSAGPTLLTSVELRLRRPTSRRRRQLLKHGGDDRLGLDTDSCAASRERRATPENWWPANWPRPAVRSSIGEAQRGQVGASVVKSSP